MLKKNISCLILSSAAALYPPSVWKAPVSLKKKTKSPLIGQLTHAWTSTANSNKAALLNHFLHAKLATKHKLYKFTTL